MVEENLTLTLPEGFRWLTGKIVSAPSKMAQVKVDGQHLVFELGLFQRREVIHFVALAEVPLQPHLDAGKTVEEKMSFTLRIADSSPVKTRDVPTSDRFKFLKRQLIAPAVMFVVIYSLFFGLMFLLPSYEKLQYSMVLDESTSMDVTAFLKKDGTIEVKDASGSVVKTFPYETFRHESTIEVDLLPKNLNFLVLSQFLLLRFVRFLPPFF
jgi:hypothetical protein